MAFETNAAPSVVSAIRAFLVVRREDAIPFGSVASWATSTRGRAALGRIGRAAIGVAILIYLFTFVPVSHVLSAISSTEAGWVLLALGLRVMERLTAAASITILTRHLGMPLSVAQNWKIGMISMFYGTFLPGTLVGGAVRWYRMSRLNRMRAEAAAAVTFDRLIGTIILVITGLIFWFLENPAAASPTFNAALMVLLTGLLGGLCFSLSRRATSILIKPVARVASRSRLRSVYAGFEKVLASLQRLRHLPARAAATMVAATATRQLLTVGALSALAHALGLSIDFVTLGWICSFIAIALLMPITISGLGFREGALVVLLEPYGVSGSSAVALAFLVLLAHLAVAAGGGVLELKHLLAGVLSRGDPGQGDRECNHIPRQAV